MPPSSPYIKENVPRNGQHRTTTQQRRKSGGTPTRRSGSSAQSPPHPHRHAVASASPRPAVKPTRKHSGSRSSGASPADVLKFFSQVKSRAERTPKHKLITDAGERFMRALAAAVELREPRLLAAATDLIGRLSADPEGAALLANKRYLAVLESALARDAAAAADGDGGHQMILDAWRGAGRSVRNLSAFSETNARVVARETQLVRLMVRRLEGRKAAEQSHTTECIAALANIIRYGNQFQSYVHKHGGLRVAACLARERHVPSIQFHSLRALAEFSLNTKWTIGLVNEGIIENALKVIDQEPDVEISAEATRTIGNMAASKTGRDAVVQHNGVEIVSNRAASMGESVQGTLVREFKFTKKDQYLAVDLFRAMANMCVENKDAVRKLVDGPGLMALISGCDENEQGVSDGVDDMVRKNLKKEAFRGLLIVSQAGPNFRAEVLREIGIRIRHDTILGRSIGYLYDLGRRIKVEASSEHKDDIPQTIAGLGTASRNYILTSGALSSAKGTNNKSVPNIKSPGRSQFRNSNRIFSVHRPQHQKHDVDRRRRENVSPPGSSATSSSRSKSSQSSSVRTPSRRRSENVDMIPRATRLDKDEISDSSGGNLITSALQVIQNAIASTTTPPENANRPNQLTDTASTVDTFEEEDVDDIYEIGPVLGRGGFATVYLAKNLTTKELVAVKRFHPPLNDTPEALKKSEQAARRAVKEQRIWDGLSHKNVVSYRGCFFGESAELNLVAEYIPGWSLADHLSQISKFPEHMVARITRQIVDGLEYLHKVGVTHRDLKPANILVDPSGLIKITDFGVSSAVDVQTMTGGAALVGTPWYIAPEMILGKKYGKTVDVWSLGCTVLELACGRRPYHNMRAHAAMFHMTQNRHPPIPRNFSPKLKDFLKTCWVWNPEARPAPSHLRRHPFLSNITDPGLHDLKNKKRTI